jgi:outer membrane protein assembly factor BamB
MVLVHTSNGQLQALNETDGAVKWTVNLDMPALSLRGESARLPPTRGDRGRRQRPRQRGIDAAGQMIWQQRISTATGRRKSTV